MAKQQPQAGTNETFKGLLLYPDQIRVQKGFNVRENMDITEMTKLIAPKEKGQPINVEMPIKVMRTNEKTEDGYRIYELVDGHRRHKAALLMFNKDTDNADLYLLPAMDVGDLTKAEQLVLMLRTGEGNQRLTMLEFAKGVHQLLAEGKKKSEVARELGKTPTHIDDCEILMTASKDVLDAVRQGKTSATQVVEMLKAADGNIDEVEAVTKKAVATATEAGKKKVTNKDLKAAAGKEVTKKGNAAASASNKKGLEEGSTAKGKHAGAIQVLSDLEEALVAQTDMKLDKKAMDLLKDLKALLAGKKDPIDLTKHFFPETEADKKEAVKKPSLKERMEAAVAEDDLPKNKKAAKKPTTAPAKSAKPAPEPEEDELEEEVEEKPAKKAKAAAKKPAAKAKPEPEEEDLDEDEDIEDDELDSEEDYETEEEKDDYEDEEDTDFDDEE